MAIAKSSARLNEETKNYQHRPFLAFEKYSGIVFAPRED